MKKALFFILAAIMLIPTALAADMEMDVDSGDAEASNFYEGDIVVDASAIEIAAPSAILMEKSTGTIIYEKNADTKMEPASVTKVMTMLLVVEAIEAKTISIDDMVSVSAYAASMGGSQIYLEEGEQMSVKDLMKAVAVSSANDASVALAEHISGTEQAFAARMNERALELGMTNSYFMNCSGLLDQLDHVTTARDIAIMSRELIKHEWIKEYTTIWMDTVRGGEFGLSSTNKMIYYYDGSTGLKTGFTRRAGYCLSATAERDGIEYIAVVMNCTTSPERFESAKTLLSFAFANYTLIPAAADAALPPVRVSLGTVPYIQPVLETDGNVLIQKTKVASVVKEVELLTDISAPITAGQEIGRLTISAGDDVIAVVPIVSSADSARITWGQMFVKMLALMFSGRP